MFKHNTVPTGRAGTRNHKETNLQGKYEERIRSSEGRSCWNTGNYSKQTLEII